MSIINKKLERMKECLRDAGVCVIEMPQKEIEETFEAINSSRDVSETVNLDDSDSESEPINVKTRLHSDSVDVFAIDNASSQWLSKPRGSTQGSDDKFKYKIPKLDASSKIIPLEALNANNPITSTSRALPEISIAQRNLFLATIKPIYTNPRSCDSNEFAALDNGDPRDFPLVLKIPLTRITRSLSAEKDAAATLPPYSDPKVISLPFEERHAIIGTYLRDMQLYLLKLARSSDRKAPWGKPIFSSNRFSGTLDKDGSRAMSQSSIKETDANQDVQMDDLMNEKPPNSPLPPSFQDEIATDPFQSTEEVRTNTRVQRKRKSIKESFDSLSSGSDEENNGGSDFEDTVTTKRKKKTNNKPRLQKPAGSSTIPVHIPGITDPYAELISKRPEVSLKGAIKRTGRGRGGRRGGAGKTTNAEIMERSSLFKDSPAVKAGVSNVPKPLGRNRRLIDLAQAEESRKVLDAKEVAKFVEASAELAEVDDDQIPQFVDEEEVSAQLFDKLIKRKIPVPLPKARPGINRLPRQQHGRRESTDDVFIEPHVNRAEVEEQLPCPMCNVMYKLSAIEDHAANCEGSESVDTRNNLTCFVCDTVFLLNTDYEVHSSSCIQIAKTKP